MNPGLGVLCEVVLSNRTARSLLSFSTIKSCAIPSPALMVPVGLAKTILDEKQQAHIRTAMAVISIFLMIVM